MNKDYLFAIFTCLAFLTNAQEYKKMIDAGTYTVQEIQQSAEAYFAKVGTERGKGFKPYKRWEYQALRNMDENGMLPSPVFYNEVLNNYNNYINENYSNASRTTVGDWEQLGPYDWNSTSGWNPGVGRVTSLDVDANNLQHIIIGAETGGIWRTIDGGVTWTALTDNLSDLRAYALSMDPTNSTTYFWGSVGAIFKSTDSGNTWNLLASVDGTVNKILIDPNNTNKMYCTSSSGIYKSIDAGVNWSLINASATIGYDVEFKPGDTNTIYASGTQFFKSTDGGATFESPSGLDNWTQEQVSGNLSWTITGSNQNNSVTPNTGNGMAMLYINNFTDPITNLVTPSLDLSGASAPEVKFSFTNVDWAGDLDELRVFYKTSTGGTWTLIPGAEYTTENTTWQDVTLSLPNPSADYYIAFQGLADYGRGLTLDDVSVEDATLGVVFEDGFESSPNQFASGAKMIGVSPADPNRVYVLEAAAGIFGGFHSSTNQGDNFTKLDHGTNNYFGYSSQADDDRGQAPRDMDIVVHPNNADEVHIAGILTWRSTNAGVSFNITSQWTPGGAASQNIGYCHADVDIMKFVGDKLFVGTDGGIFKAENASVSPVGTNFYTDLTEGLGIKQFYKIGISQSNPVVVTGGAQDNGSSVLNANGDWTDWLGADGMESFVDKNNNNILYGTTQFGTLYRSTNSGANISNLPSPDQKSGNWITPFEQDPTQANTVYTGYDQVYKSTNGGFAWTAISQTFGGNLNELKIAASDNAVMYASRGGNLYKTTDGGATNWSTVSLPANSGNINSIAIHPTDANKVALAISGADKVLVTTNGGTNWNSYLSDLPDFSARALTWFDNQEDGLYLGMNYGVYFRDNTTEGNWLPFSNNLPNVIISELEINYVDEKLYAATYGRGLWRTNLYNALTTNEFAFEGLSVYPNPAKDKIKLRWNNSENVAIRVYDQLGKLMYFNNKQNLADEFSIDVSNFATGLYFVKINNQKGFITKKIIVE